MSKCSECDEARFLGDVERHEMTVIRDEGVNRHIRFKRPGTSAYYFDLITWQGHLCFTGDMGTFVFSRTDDMFDFFRMDDHDWNKNPNGLSINPGYWSEKVLAEDRNSGIEAWDEEEFTRRVNEYRVNWMRDMKGRGTSAEERRELWEVVDREVLGESDNEDISCVRVYEFYETVAGERYEFFDFFDGGTPKRFTFRFLWCCYALAWGINQYDNHRSSKS